MLPTFSRHGTPDGHPAAVPDRRPAPDALSGRTPGPWWEHLELDRPDSGGAHPAGGTAGMAASPQERRTLAVMLRAARVGDNRGVLSPSVMSETAPERGRAPRVVLADDDVLLREGLASLLDRSGFDVVGQAGNGPGLLALVRSARPDLARRRRDPLDVLSPRERDVLALMAEGASNAGVARRIFVTEGTVEKHVRSILTKLNLPERDTEHRRVLAVLRFLEAR